MGLLKGNSKECFPNVNYDNLVAELQFDETSSVESSYYEYREITKGGVFWEDNKKYTYHGLVSTPRTDGLSISHYVYYVQVYRDSASRLLFCLFRRFIKLLRHKSGLLLCLILLLREAHGYAGEYLKSSTYA